MDLVNAIQALQMPQPNDPRYKRGPVGDGDNANFSSYVFSELFNCYNPVEQPLSQKTSTDRISVYAPAANDEDYFVVADFQLAYDPCICFFSQGLHVDFFQLTSGEITGQGDFLGAAQPLVAADPDGPEMNPNYLLSALKPSFDSSQLLMESYYIDQYQANLDSTAAVNGGNQVLAAGIKNVLNVFTGALTKLAPSGGMPAGIDTKDVFDANDPFTNFMSSIFGLNFNTTTEPMVMYGDLAFNANLNVSTPANVSDFIIGIPGAPNSYSLPEYATSNINGFLPVAPIYNQIPGLFALKNTPTLNAFQMYNTDPSDLLPPNNHYEVQLAGTDVNYLLSPIVNSANTQIFAALELYIPMEEGATCDTLDNLSYIDSTNSYFSDGTVDSTIKRFRTKFFALECLPQVIGLINFPQFEFGDNLANSVVANLVFQVYYEFNPDVYNGFVNHTYQTFKYPLAINIVNNTLITNPNFSTLLNIPTNEVFGPSTTTFTAGGIYFSYGTVSITGNLSNTSGQKVYIQATQAINVEPGVMIGPDIILQITQTPSICAGISPIAPSTADAGYCSSSSYKASQLSISYPRLVNNTEDSGESNNVVSFALSLYPNPTKDKCTILFSLPQTDNCNIKLVDMMGRDIKLIDNGWHVQGNSTVAFNTSDLAAGVYMVRFSDGTNTTTKKLTISK